MESIDRAIDYCTSFDEEFPGKLVGAPAERIEDIERRLGREVSAVHRGFLERAGVSAGWLTFGSLNTTIDAVLDAHWSTYGPVPEGFELFGVDQDEPDEDAYLVARPAGEPTVDLIASHSGVSYATLPQSPRQPYAGSLPELICRQALFRFRIEPMPLRSVFSLGEGEEPLHERFDELISRRGFTVLWFSDWMSRVAVREETTVFATQAAGQPMAVTLAASDAE